MSAAEAAAKADEAMGGRPALAPKVKAGAPAADQPPAMGTDYNPARE